MDDPFLDELRITPAFAGHAAAGSEGGAALEQGARPIPLLPALMNQPTEEESLLDGTLVIGDDGVHLVGGAVDLPAFDVNLG
jgi:hypothetical protein